MGDDPRVVGVRVEAALAAADLGRGAGDGQLRPLGDRDPPALVVGQVQVQDVELVERGEVDQAQDVVDAEEVARDVEHEAAPAVARRVLDHARRDRRRRAGAAWPGRARGPRRPRRRRPRRRRTISSR